MSTATRCRGCSSVPARLSVLPAWDVVSRETINATVRQADPAPRLPAQVVPGARYAKGVLIGLHPLELQPGVGTEFEPVDAQLHEIADGRLAEAGRAGREEGRMGQGLLADRLSAESSGRRHQEYGDGPV